MAIVGTTVSTKKSYGKRFASLAPDGLLWILIVAAFFALPDSLLLGSQILVMVIFVLSLDLLLGVTGIATLGHAAFFGLGAYTAGILASHGWNEPLTGLMAGGIAAGALGLLSGAVVLRASGLAQLMLTLALVFMLYEVANQASWLTGGADGLSGVEIAPLLGFFEFDLFGQTAYVYAAVVLAFSWLLFRQISRSPFGHTLIGVRENPRRMEALGVSVFRFRLAAYLISAVMAGVAGGLLAQTTQYVALNVVSFELSGAVLVMLILGGTGRGYGAVLGAAIYMIAQDLLSKLDPVFWLFWIGLILVVVVLLAPQGIIGLISGLFAPKGASDE
ncbi:MULTISPECIES: branched-chain amino acid ABC transporter permease [Rhizobium/Agrobacterium group]|uniref:branched-chain amino acid ABC transporter permease n=1 Tax=Rhizobium/Agrobacterium group TaxID=227290 RepID=UPI0022B817E3|nr:MULTISPECIES: branched-chain amino acid ABC transporter permease [Rhizobium/Agrobacterium group]MCZ7889967.1 branched-chain amino acid ABC transporter permease [Agrobacterium salinitolerans]MDA5636468.1 branched-chain amino acid ABC transporter permease [Agrobacterium sp. ST15.16.024]MDF1892316.1 branched-chain amino acid ABC transporter permease [Rhizobium rhizogenes]